NVILFLIIARYYGPKIFGQFTFAHSLSYIFIILADFGFDVLLTNEIAKDRNNAVKIFQQYFSLKFVFTLFALVSMWIFVLFNDLSYETRLLVMIFSIYMVFTNMTNFLYALYKGFERLEFETKVSLIINISLLILTIILMILKADIITIAVAFVSTRILGFLFGVKYSFIVLKGISFKLLFTGFSKIKKKVFVFGFNLAFNYLFFQLDTILLAFWKGDYEVGIYQSVFKLILIPLVIPDIFINTLLPVLSRLNVENKAQWKKIGGIMNKLLFIIIIPISIILFIYADQIINIVYGVKEYSSAIPILRIFALTLFVRFNLEAFALMLTTSNRQHVRMKVVITATFLNLILNYFMINSYGAYGAAIVSLLTNTFVGVMYYLSTLPLFFEWVINTRTIVVLVLSCALAYSFWLLRSYSIFIFTPIILLLFAIITFKYFLTEKEKNLILPLGIKIPFIN
ncbi:MAG TPA: flippase, partial [Ignavibacteria bacterium]|nr:flippase [Ignavibacteria bacterium]